MAAAVQKSQNNYPSRLAYHAMDRKLLQKVADAYDTTIEKIEKYEENVSNSFLYSIYMMSQAASGKSDMLAADGHIYVAEQEVIKRLAANTSAIFLGHCASEALKEKNGVIKCLYSLLR